MHKLEALSNEELLVSFRARVKNVRRDEASIVAHLVEIEQRRIHVDAACSSMWTYCVEREGFSESQAYTRLAAARVVRDFPIALEYLARGDIHLCGLTELRRALTRDNHEALLRQASGMSTRALRGMIAARFPRPDVGSKIEPLSATRYRIEVTVSARVNEVIEELKDLMAHRNPSRDLEVILTRALFDLHEKLQKELLAKTSRPKGAVKESTRPGYIPRAVRREVFERDGARCTYVDEHGRRCAECGGLELHHIVSKALGGPDTAENLTVRCRPHNLRDAEQVFGVSHVEERIHFERSKRRAMRSPAFESAERGLVGDFGFVQKDVRAALAKLAQELDPKASSAEVIIRSALRLLT